LPHALAVGDFAGDGHLDIVTVNAAPSNSVSIFLGNGDGTFRPGKTYATGANPARVAVADLNGDGNLDLAITNYNDGTVRILFGNGDGTFRPGGTYFAGQHPLAVAAADFNGDGFPDLVISDDDPVDQILSLPNNGQGGFPFNAAYPTGKHPQAITVGDFTGDGRLDVVTAESLDQTVRWFKGNGDATFQAGLPFFTGLGQDVVAADFKGDGILDLATAGGDASAGLGISPGNGNGTFQKTITVPVEMGTRAVVAADFNGNGLPDVVTVDQQTDNLSLLYNYGNLAFQAAASFPAGPGQGANPTAVAVGDFNGDGFPDLAVTDQNFNYLAILMNHPQVTHFHLTGPESSTAGTPVQVTVTALDEGNIQAPQYGGTVHFTSTDSQAALPDDYTFKSADHGIHTFSVTLKTAGVQTVTASDVGAPINGSTDVVVNPAAANHFIVEGFPSPITAGTAGTFTVTAQDPYGNVATGYTGTVKFASSDGQASLPGNYMFTVNDKGTATFTATLKTAGIQSLTALDSFNGSIIGSQTGISVTPAQASKLVLTVPNTAELNDPFTATVTARDPFNNVATSYAGTVHFTSSDSYAKLPPDYVFTDVDAGVHSFSVSLGTLGSQTITVTDVDNSLLTGTGTVSVSVNLFGPPIKIPTGSRPRGVATGDFNGDGFQDIVTADEYGGTYSIILGNGDGTFQAAHIYSLGQTPTDVAVADVNGDGIPDLITALYGAGKVDVLLGNGDGTFQAPVAYSAGSQPNKVAVADFNGDGILDMAVANYGSKNVSILLGDGTGKFGPPTNFAVNGNPWWVTAVDLTGNGILDLVTANNQPSVSVLLGNGDGTFRPGVDLGADPHPRDVEAGDFNGDGIPDLAVGNYESGTIFIYLGNGDGTFKGPTKYTEFGQGPQSMVLADVNGDGYLDVVTADQGGGTWVLLGKGDGTFQPPLSYQVGGTALAVTTGDFNGDGAPDVVTASDGVGAIIQMNLAPAKAFEVMAPDTVTAGVPFEVTVSAQNAFGGTALGYLGTVHFTSTDEGANLPTDYHFTAADKGVHTFTVTLNTSGDQVLTVIDTQKSTLTGSAIITVTTFRLFPSTGNTRPELAFPTGPVVATLLPWSSTIGVLTVPPDRDPAAVVEKPQPLEDLLHTFSANVWDGARSGQANPTHAVIASLNHDSLDQLVAGWGEILNGNVLSTGLPLAEVKPRVF
jgi:hypothetical protein